MGVANIANVSDVSARLRAERQRAGLTIDEVSARTKIKPAMLHALERGAFEELPGEFFARAFVKTYARELKLPTDEILAEYDAQRTGPVEHAVVVADAAHEDHEPSGTLRIPAPSSAWPIAALVAAIVIIVILMSRTGPVADPDSAVAEESVGTTGNEETRPAADASEPMASAETLTVEIRPTRPVWVTAVADGDRVLFRTLEAGERIVIDAHDDLKFRVGDAGAFEYTLNGHPGPPPGRDGEVRDFTITRDTYRSMIRADGG